LAGLMIRSVAALWVLALFWPPLVQSGCAWTQPAPWPPAVMPVVAAAGAAAATLAAATAIAVPHNFQLLADLRSSASLIWSLLHFRHRRCRRGPP
jgi:hypothetical protein